jgi:hypothetical protein
VAALAAAALAAPAAWSATPRRPPTTTALAKRITALTTQLNTLRRRLARLPATGLAGPAGAAGAAGAPGAAGTAGGTGPAGADGARGQDGAGVFTFADAGDPLLQGAGTDVVVTTTTFEDAPPGGNAAQGGLLVLPLRPPNVVIATAKVSAPGGFECALQANSGGGWQTSTAGQSHNYGGLGTHYLSLSAAQGSPGLVGSNASVTLRYRLVCRGGNGLAVNADLGVIAVLRP